MNKNKLITSLLAVLILLSTLSISAFASDDINFKGANSDGHDFTTAWRAYTSADDGNGLLTYGFNTFLIDEDYAWGDHETKIHVASLRNDNGWHAGPICFAGYTSKIEVTHSGNSIYYDLEW